MSRFVKTQQNDSVDLIAYRHYGVRAGSVEALLEANRHLGAQGAVLPLGLDVLLPDLGPATEPRLSLWSAP